MDDVSATYVVTLPNADPGNAVTRAVLVKAVERGGTKRIAVESMGERRYWGLMRFANAMLGNSSSALVEAPAVALPAVNVGDRQKGRVRGSNVIDVPPERARIAAALREALSPEGKARAVAGTSPFGDGHSAPRIVEAIARWTPPRPPVKRFVSVASPVSLDGGRRDRVETTTVVESGHAARRAARHRARRHRHRVRGRRAPSGSWAR